MRGLIDGGADLHPDRDDLRHAERQGRRSSRPSEIFAEKGVRLPVMISGTITDLSGRTLSGQTPTAFWNSIRHAKPLTIGLNCALGAAAMRPHLAELSRRRRHASSAPIPMPACPTNSASYDESPESMARADRGLCARGSRQHRRRLLRHDARPYPRHRRGGRPAQAARSVAGAPSRCCGCRAWSRSRSTKDIPFVNVGERTNVTGSAKFRKLITAGDYTAALDVARDQVAERRADHRHQHGRGPARLREGDGRVPQPDRRRAGHRPRADDDRQLEMGGDRGRAEMRAGQADRQFDLDEGGRGDVPRSTPGCAAPMAPPSSSWPSTSRARPTPMRARSRSARAPTSC